LAGDEPQMTEELTTDLIVIGAGLAGCVCALTAAANAAEVLLVEQLDRPGGSSSMSAGCFAFAETELQHSLGIDDSRERLFADLREVGKHENVVEVVQAYVDEQLATYAWLCESGAEFNPVIEASSGHSVPRVHTTDPAKLMCVLGDLCNFRVNLWRAARAERLLTREGSSVVAGVRIRGPVKTFNVFARAGVVLTTGGFSQDRDLIHRYAPLYDDAVFRSSPGANGDGLRMACAVGADLRDMIYIKGTFGVHPAGGHNSLNCMAVYKGAIAVNRLGRRFADESQSYKLLGDACMMQPEHVAYQILDQEILESGEKSVPILNFMTRFEAGQFISADTLEELSGLIGISPVELTQTVRRYNQGVTKGIDPDFGRQHLVHQHGALRRIERAPFHAYPSTAAVFGTYCGIAVDAGMRVRNVFGEPIPGLYAAGEVVGGLHGAAYMTGSALAKAAIFGRIAARDALTRGRVTHPLPDSE
jgi:fumarate reductase flavoprotein subunit